MAKYRKKPVEVEAFRYGYEYAPEWFYDGFDNGLITVNTVGNLFVHTNSKKYPRTYDYHIVYEGDYIVKDVCGNLYVYRYEEFKAIYEPADSVAKEIYDMNVKKYEPIMF